MKRIRYHMAITYTEIKKQYHNRLREEAEERGITSSDEWLESHTPEEQETLMTMIITASNKRSLCQELQMRDTNPYPFSYDSFKKLARNIERYITSAAETEEDSTKEEE